MSMIKITSLAALALQLSALVATPSQAGTSEFIPASACVGTTIDGELVTSVWYQSGVAVNNHSSSDRDMICPIRYERLNTVSTSVIVRAVVYDNTNDSGGKAAVWICNFEAQGGCNDVASTSDAFRGESTLEVSLTPNASTRFLNLRVRLPDVDGDGRSSFLVGYRVCRGSC